MSFEKRACGILLHTTSLPGAHGIGDLGGAAYRFADFLAAAGQRYWQMLPVGPLGFGDSPYMALSSFVGEPLLVSLEKLREEGLLDASDIANPPSFPPGRVDFDAVRRFKEPLFGKAFAAFEKGANGEIRRRFESFCEDGRSWLLDFALFLSLRRANGESAWTDWAAELRARDPEALRKVLEELKDKVRYHQFVQFAFFRQWAEFRSYCSRRDVSLVGDVPIFAAHDSADVWANQDAFCLGSDGQPVVVAGVPPDYFSRTGQRWGNPLYRWDVLRERKYGWWMARLKSAFGLFDAVRLDHFIGFQRYWEIPASSPTAQQGRWVAGPGAHFFETVRESLGGAKFIAEDLGTVTPEVLALRDAFGFPGMRVLQFAFGGPADGTNPHLPHNYTAKSVVYTGTHDNDTTLGWFRGTSSEQGERPAGEAERVRENVLSYVGGNGKEIHRDLMRLAYSSIAETVIIPMQDVLGLGSESRMNVPGTVSGNWRWRMADGRLGGGLAKELLAMARFTGRAR